MIEIRLTNGSDGYGALYFANHILLTSEWRDFNRVLQGVLAKPEYDAKAQVLRYTYRNAAGQDLLSLNSEIFPTGGTDWDCLQQKWQEAIQGIRRDSRAGCTLREAAAAFSLPRPECEPELYRYCFDPCDGSKKLVILWGVYSNNAGMPLSWGPTENVSGTGTGGFVPGGGGQREPDPDLDPSPPPPPPSKSSWWPMVFGMMGLAALIMLLIFLLMMIWSAWPNKWDHPDRVIEDTRHTVLLANLSNQLFRANADIKRLNAELIRIKEDGGRWSKDVLDPESAIRSPSNSDVQKGIELGPSLQPKKPEPGATPTPPEGKSIPTDKGNQTYQSGKTPAKMTVTDNIEPGSESSTEELFPGLLNEISNAPIDGAFVPAGTLLKHRWERVGNDPLLPEQWERRIPPDLQKSITNEYVVKKFRHVVTDKAGREIINQEVEWVYEP